MKHPAFAELVPDDETIDLLGVGADSVIAPRRRDRPCERSTPSGRALFAGDNPTRVLIAVMGDEPPRVRDFAPDVDPRLDDLVWRMVAKKPADRPAGMQAVLDELAEI